MTSPKSQNDRKQKLVDKLFDTQGTYWRNTYKEKDISAIIYQQRQAVALRYTDELNLPKTARVLEIGCGAGFLTTALAKRGFTVQAIDHAQTMIDLTLENATQAGFETRIIASTGDAHELSYGDQSFDLIVALGVIPWLHDYQKALTEIARVTMTNGHIIISMDNASRASTLLDPKTFPLFAHIQQKVKTKFEQAKLLTSYNPWVNAPPYRQHSPKEFTNSLCEGGLTVIKSTSVGFGPFTFLGHPLFSEKVAIKIHQNLQKYADRGYPIFRSTGSQFIVLATKTTKQIT